MFKIKVNKLVLSIAAGFFITLFLTPISSASAEIESWEKFVEPNTNFSFEHPETWQVTEQELGDDNVRILGLPPVRKARVCSGVCSEITSLNSKGQFIEINVLEREPGFEIKDTGVKKPDGSIYKFPLNWLENKEEIIPLTSIKAGGGIGIARGYKKDTQMRVLKAALAPSSSSDYVYSVQIIGMKDLQNFDQIYTHLKDSWEYTSKGPEVFEPNLQNGDLAREEGDIDIYILKKLANGKKFKRLVLNPAVFHSYGHLKPDDVKVVPRGTLDDYETSNLVRAVDPAQGVDDPKVYKLIPEGDKGKKQWIKNMETFNERGFDFDAIYQINAFERDIYESTDSLDLTEDGDSDSVSCGGEINYRGQAYSTVKIGDQCWMAENLNVGTMVQGETNQSDNNSLEKYCYNNKSSNCETYGGLYQWGEAMQYSDKEGAPGICPDGWHIPTDEEFHTLESKLTYEDNTCDKSRIGYYGCKPAAPQMAGSKLLWEEGMLSNHDDFGASGFSALPAGNHSIDGGFRLLGNRSDFWSSNKGGFDELYETETRINRGLHYDAKGSLRQEYPPTVALSVRCIKD